MACLHSVPPSSSVTRPEATRLGSCHSLHWLSGLKLCTLLPQENHVRRGRAPRLLQTCLTMARGAPEGQVLVVVVGHLPGGGQRGRTAKEPRSHREVRLLRKTSSHQLKTIYHAAYETEDFVLRRTRCVSTNLHPHARTVTSGEAARFLSAEQGLTLNLIIVSQLGEEPRELPRRVSISPYSV